MPQPRNSAGRAAPAPRGTAPGEALRFSVGLNLRKATPIPMSGAAGPRRMDRRPLRQTHLSVDLHRLAFGLLCGIVLWCGVVLAGCSSVAQPTLYARSGGADGLAA